MQAALCEEFGNICRVVWNTGLDQRRLYRRRGAWMNYVPPGRRAGRRQARPPLVESSPLPRASAHVEGSRPGLPGPRNIQSEVALEDALGTLVPLPRREPRHPGTSRL
ncbi:helix-turn-helix domain-containing protein [Streptomyces sp. NPDC093982]|uniref:helix-turn-helix domain-containing protein n=1 Tax=Streptomyces sp. NPDC093982 TaxID=3155077 RepID=UPI00342FFA3E